MQNIMILIIYLNFTLFYIFLKEKVIRQKDVLNNDNENSSIILPHKA